MQKSTICLTYNDQAEEAAKHYTSIFKDSKIIQTVSMGAQGISEAGDKVLLVMFEMNGVKYMALNGGPSFSFTHGTSIMVNCDTQDEIDFVWDRLCEGGKEVECGWLVDKFGVSWQVVPSMLGKLMDARTPDRAKRVFDALMKMKKLSIPTLQKAYDGV